MVRTRAIQETEEERDDSALLVLEPNHQNIDKTVGKMKVSDRSNMTINLQRFDQFWNRHFPTFGSKALLPATEDTEESEQFPGDGTDQAN